MAVKCLPQWIDLRDPFRRQQTGFNKLIKSRPVGVIAVRHLHISSWTDSHLFCYFTCWLAEHTCCTGMKGGEKNHREMESIGEAKDRISGQDEGTTLP